MKKFLSVVIFLALSLGLRAEEVKVEFRKMTAGTGNMLSPVVAENSSGERIYTFRGGDRAAHYYYYKNGTWTGGGRIPGSPLFVDYWFADIVADSDGTFHYVCEEADKFMYYGQFKNGEWVPMRKIDVKHEATLALGVRSDDTIVLAAPIVTRNPKGVTKDIVVGTKAPSASNFTGFKNVTNDYEGSTMVDLAIDAEDNTWISYKGGIFKGGGETMQAVLFALDKNDKEIYFKNVSDQAAAWCWYPRVAINSDGLVMVTWMMSQQRTYFFRRYDPAKDTWTAVKELAAGTTRPWPFMYNKLLARGKDFYWVGLDGDRTLSLYRYDPALNDWDKLADVSQGAANWFSACNAAEGILIPWESERSPSEGHLTTVFVAPIGPKISGKVSQGSLGISGVTMTGFSGLSSTDSTGAYAGNVETGWTGAIKPYKPGYRFEPESRTYQNVTADLAGQDYTAVTQFDLTISAGPGGTTSPAPAVYPKDKNSPVTVRAVPSPGYMFDKWTGSASGSANPITLTMTGDKAIRANFIQVNLTITATAGGTTSPPPGTYHKELNSSVTVRAIPSPSYRFDKWTGDASGSANPITLTIDRSKTVRANFVQLKPVINLSVEKRIERSYFGGYTLNALTWQANPENAAKGFNVTVQRVYRNTRTGSDASWERIAEVAGSVLNYEDRDIPEDSDYIYAVTCVDDKGVESLKY